MHNPPHPDNFINGVYLEPHGFSHRKVAELLDVAPSTLSRLIKGSAGGTPEMALRLSKTLGRAPESWLAMQHNDLWQARKTIDLRKVGKLEVDAA